LPVGFEALRGRGFASRRPEKFFSVSKGETADDRLIKYLLKDAVACGCPHPTASHKQSRTRNKISKKPAGPGWRRMSPAPRRDEWGAGDTEVAPATVHI